MHVYRQRLRVRDGLLWLERTCGDYSYTLAVHSLSVRARSVMRFAERHDLSALRACVRECVKQSSRFTLLLVQGVRSYVYVLEHDDNDVVKMIEPQFSWVECGLA